jgi:tRNA A-37 threonylcarbamoyl transferase component Bud32
LGTRSGFRTTITEALAATVVDESGPASNLAPFPTELLPDVGHLVGGHYRLVRLLGKGMFGKVYVAQRVDVPAHQVALKVVPREVYSGRNVERELVMLAAASHPNIAQLKDHGTTESYVWLTMPVYEGETLAERLRRGTLSLEEAHEIFLPIARALDALHEAGLRHQDIKPENIFLATFAGRLHPILLDLGVAAERDATFVAGTILYASPEQLSALSKSPESLLLSDKMDTYCLASTLLVSLVGPRQFPGDGADTRLEIVQAQSIRASQPLAYSALPELSGAPRAKLRDAFCRWLDPDPKKRPSVSIMAEELDVLLEPQRERARRSERRRLRQKIVRRVTLAAILVLGGVGALFAYSKRETLRLASELNRARAEGAASFDKLDTCVASHQLAQREAQVCREAKAKEQAEFKTMLDQISRSGESEGERARQMQALQATFATRLKTCEDEASASAKERSAEREKLTSEFQRKETQLVTERDDQKKLAETQTAELERCRTENGAEARPASAERSGSVRAPSPAAGSAAPAASMAVPAASGAAPTAPVTTAASPGAPVAE